jgi:hypothetical protein
MNPEQTISEIDTLHRDAIIHWKKNAVQLNQTGFLKNVEENHAFNYQLWHEEDKARREDMGFEFVYQAKRKIDHFNQQRNNCMEQIDIWLQAHLNPVDPARTPCPVHSETPGMIIDRLSILTLKHYHMALQTTREDVDDAHRQNCGNKLALIENQRNQLLSCLQEFLQGILDKTRTFKLYHQLKMYNDKRLNPELYAEKT